MRGAQHNNVNCTAWCVESRLEDREYCIHHAAHCDIVHKSVSDCGGL